MRFDWQALGTATLRRASFVALAAGVVVASLTSFTHAQGLPKASVQRIKIDCNTPSATCDQAVKAWESLELLRTTYLESVGACGKGDACSKGVRANSLDPVVMQRMIAFSFEQCVAIKCPSEQYPPRSDALEQCKQRNCGSPPQ